MIQNNIIRNKLKEVNEKLIYISNVFKNCSLQIYKGTPQNTYKNVSFDNSQVDYFYIPSYFKYIPILSLSQVNTLIQYYIDKVSDTINYFNLNNLNIQLQDKINDLNISIGTLDTFARLLLGYDSEFIYQYTVPQDMSLRMAIFNNNYDFNTQLDQILLLNANVIESINLIRKGTVLKFQRY